MMSHLVIINFCSFSIMSLFDALPLEIKKYVLKPFLDPASLLMLKVALYNYKITKWDFTVDVQKWTIGHGLSFTLHCWSYLNRNDIFSYAAEMGSRDVIKYAREHGICRNIINKKVYALAAKNNHREILLYLRRYPSQFPPSENASNTAAEYNNTSLVIWLNKNGFCHGKNVCLFAVQHNNIKMFHYAISHDFRCYINVTKTAATLGRLEFLRYIYETPKLRLARTDQVISIAHEKDHKHIIEYLYSEGLV